MVYFKVLLNDKRLKSDNIYPVVIRVTHNRNNTTVSTGLRVPLDSWDNNLQQVRGNFPNALQINKSITECYGKVQRVTLKLIDDNNFTFDNLKEGLTATVVVAVKTSTRHCFNTYADQLIADMFEFNKAGNAIVYQTASRRLLNYSGQSSLPFDDITYTFLDGFRSQLIKDGVKQNTISNYFRTIRAIFNKAIKVKLVDRSVYPFRDIPIKTERTAKRALSIAYLQTLFTIDLKPGTQKWHARNFFLLSFCLRGASFTDLAYLTSDNLKKGRLVYRRRKTHKELNIGLTNVAKRTLTMYGHSHGKYLLPILPTNIIEDSKRAKAIISQWIKTSNKWLSRLATDCKIEAELTTYVTRHSWATTAKKLGYSIELIAECLGHEHGNKITNIYLDTFEPDVIDEVNQKVINSVMLKEGAGL